MLLEKTAELGTIQSILKTDGAGYQTIIVPGGGFRNYSPKCDDMVWEDGNIRNLYNIHMQGDNVFSFTISDVPRTIKEFLQRTETTVAEYDCFAFHQANRFIMEMLAKKLKADFSKFLICLDRFGNTSGPSIPMALCDHYGNEILDGEINVLMSGYGVGLSWGVCSAKINKRDIYPIVETDSVFTEGIINRPEDFLIE